MIVSPEQMKKIEEFALEKASKLDYNHNEDHVIRTVKLAEFLAEKEGADVEVCRAAAYLHDIAKGNKPIFSPKGGKRICLIIRMTKRPFQRLRVVKS